MKVEIFNFDLPKENIALRPVSPRDSARMMVIDGGIAHTSVSALPSLLQANDLLVFNDTKVIPGRLFGKRSEAKMQVTLHKRETPTNWRVFAKPAKKCKKGDTLDFSGLQAEVLEEGEAGERLIRFDVADNGLFPALHKHGVMPLPPYIASQRTIDDRDHDDYQTIYAEEEGAVAAPTAGLHFTPNLLHQLEEAGISTTHLTLHVGAGTFLPVKVDNTDDHKMHSEIGIISEESARKINATKAKGGRIVSVGTTSLRLLESAVDEQGLIQPFNGETDIFITPGYRFKAVDILMTNFHLPKSTLFMLVSAFAGFDTMKEAYQTAIEEGYRFYSYGDSSLLFRERDTL